MSDPIYPLQSAVIYPTQFAKTWHSSSKKTAWYMASHFTFEFPPGTTGVANARFTLKASKNGYVPESLYVFTNHTTVWTPDTSVEVLFAMPLSGPHAFVESVVFQLNVPYSFDITPGLQAALAAGATFCNVTMSLTNSAGFAPAFKAAGLTPDYSNRQDFYFDWGIDDDPSEEDVDHGANNQFYGFNSPADIFAPRITADLTLTSIPLFAGRVL